MTELFKGFLRGPFECVGLCPFRLIQLGVVSDVAPLGRVGIDLGPLLLAVYQLWCEHLWTTSVTGTLLLGGVGPAGALWPLHL